MRKETFSLLIGSIFILSAAGACSAGGAGRQSTQGPEGKAIEISAEERAQQALARTPDIEVAPAAAALPKVDELKRKLLEVFSDSTRVRMFLLMREDSVAGRMKMKGVPWAVPPEKVIIISYDQTTREAQIEYVHPGPSIRVLQQWRFDGNEWRDAVDAGMLRSPE